VRGFCFWLALGLHQTEKERKGLGAQSEAKSPFLKQIHVDPITTAHFNLN
jgi:hypothetical protein